MKYLCAFLLTVFLAGCAGSARDEQEYIDYGQVKGERVRIPPCNPFRADELMDWAEELDGSAYHDRDARAAVDAQGWVRCSAKEAAGSGSRR